MGLNLCAVVHFWCVGLWSLKGQRELYFSVPKGRRPETHVLFCPVASLFSNTSPLVLMLLKNKRRCRNTDSCYQGHFSHPLPLRMCDGHTTRTWGSKSLHPLITSHLLTPAVDSALNIQPREHCLFGACHNQEITVLFRFSLHSIEGGALGKQGWGDGGIPPSIHSHLHPVFPYTASDCPLCAMC